jgi:uncharacterized protein YcgI (DUF1989 family)
LSSLFWLGCIGFQSRALGKWVTRLPNANIFQSATYKVTADGSQVMGYADVPLQTKKGDYIDFSAQMNLLILVSLCPCGDQTASWKDVELTPIKVEVFETNSTPPEFPRFHNWRPNFKDMVVEHD